MIECRCKEARWGGKDLLSEWMNNSSAWDVSPGLMLVKQRRQESSIHKHTPVFNEAPQGQTSGYKCELYSEIRVNLSILSIDRVVSSSPSRPARDVTDGGYVERCCLRGNCITCQGWQQNVCQQKWQTCHLIIDISWILGKIGEQIAAGKKVNWEWKREEKKEDLEKKTV